MRPRVKICGIRRVADAERARDLGATHVGCVLAEDSPRCATLDEVRAIGDAMAGSTPVVLVFRQTTRDRTLDACARTGVDRVQIHGAAEPMLRDLEAHGVIVHRVHRVAPGATSLPALEPRPTDRRPALLDVGRGGSGSRFDWSLLGAQAPDATFVAGGITPDNIDELLDRRPWGIDVSSGIEQAPGVKDAALLQRLFSRLERIPS